MRKENAQMRDYSRQNKEAWEFDAYDICKLEPF